MKKILLGKERVPTKYFLDTPIAYATKSLYEYAASEWTTQIPIPACKSDKYEIIKKKLPKGKAISLTSRSMVKFDDDVTFTVFKERSGDIWMSDTPMELESHSPAIKAAKGNVLVAGLGLGYSLLSMAEKKSVKSIIVIEHDKEIINLVFPHLEKHLLGKVTVVNDDLFDFKTKKMFDYIWLDIWKSPDGFMYRRPELIKKFLGNCDPNKIRFWDQRFKKLPSVESIVSPHKMREDLVKEFGVRL